MESKLPKRVLRDDVEVFANREIYSTANLKSTNEYRLSIPWHNRQRGTRRHADIDPSAWDQCDRRRDRLVHELELTHPQLKGHITTAYHVVACIYLSLRISNAVLA